MDPLNTNIDSTDSVITHKSELMSKTELEDDDENDKYFQPIAKLATDEVGVNVIESAVLVTDANINDNSSLMNVILPAASNPLDQEEPSGGSNTMDRPKAPPRTKKKYRKSKTVDVTRFVAPKNADGDADSLDNSSEDFNCHSFMNSPPLSASAQKPYPAISEDSSKLDDSLEQEEQEECLNVASKKDIEFLYEIGTKIESNDSLSAVPQDWVMLNRLIQMLPMHLHLN